MSLNQIEIINKLKEKLTGLSKTKKAEIPKELVGISPAEHGLAMAHVTANAVNNIVVNSFAYTNEDSVEAQKLLINKFVAEHQLEGMPASYVLPANKYTLCMIEAPKDSKHGFKDALLSAVEEFIDYSTAEAVVDAFHLPLKRISDNKPVMYAAVTRFNNILDIEELVNSTGLLLRYVDIQELCLRNIAYLHPETTKGSMLVRFHEFGGEVILVDKSTIFATRHIDAVLSQFIEEKVAKDAVALEYNEAELLDSLCLDLQRSSDYCSNVFLKSPAQATILTPSMVDINKIYEYLKTHLELPVFKMELNEVMEFKQTSNSLDQAKCLLAIGACLRHIPEQETDAAKR